MKCLSQNYFKRMSVYVKTISSFNHCGFRAKVRPLGKKINSNYETAYLKYEKREKGERERERDHEGGGSYEIVFFSVTFDSGRALFNTFRRAVVLARIRECRYACLKQWMGNDRHNLMLFNW